LRKGVNRTLGVGLTVPIALYFSAESPNLSV
jgi:hypothetical protein